MYISTKTSWTSLCWLLLWYEPYLAMLHPFQVIVICHRYQFWIHHKLLSNLGLHVEFYHNHFLVPRKSLNIVNFLKNELWTSRYCLFKSCINSLYYAFLGAEFWNLIYSSCQSSWKKIGARFVIHSGGAMYILYLGNPIILLKTIASTLADSGFF